MLKTVFACLTAGSLLASGVIGCESASSTVTDANAKREVSEDGRVATQTRTRTRQTSSGATVRETEIQKREVISPAPTTAPVDATRRDAVAPTAH